MSLEMPRGARRIVTAGEVEAALDRMAASINGVYGSDPAVLLVVMNGGMIAAARLALKLRFPLLLDYLHVSRYRGETRGESLHWIARPRQPLTGQHVLIVDDILDEGPTLGAIQAHCRELEAASVRTAVLVDKRHGRRVSGVAADFVGLELPDRYVFGCGMDYREGYRHLPDIWAMEG